MGKGKDFDKLYEKLSPIVMSKCQRFFNDEQDALDAFQEAMVRIAAHSQKLARMEAQVAWVYRLTTNVCLNILRTKKRKYLSQWSDPDEVGDGKTLPDDRVVQRQRLYAVAKKIPKGLQPFFVSNYIDGMGQEEIAEVMGVSRSTVARNLAKLKKLLGDENE